VAVIHARPTVVEWLLSHGADPEARDEDGRKPIDLARERQDPAILSILIEFDRRLARIRQAVAARDPVALRHALNGDPRRIAAVHVWAAIGDLERVRACEEESAGLLARDTLGTTALHVSVARGDLAMTRYLLAAGLGVNDAMVDGATALGIASRHRHEAMIDLLLKHGAEERTASDR
jgi:ankyrin repeat protein